MDTRAGSTAPSEGAGPAGRPAPSRTSRRRGPRPVPERNGAYDHLTLAGLRAYRTALQDEEGRVSYWRRILQARLDVVRADTASPTTAGLDPDHLRPVLTDARTTAGRSVLAGLVDAGDIPPLPSLAELWDRRVDRHDDAGQHALEADLTEAEQQLSRYRHALHDQLSGATDELIARYRQRPLLCLTALPLPPGVRVPAPRAPGRPAGVG